jgi:hypothetical protein
MDVSLVHDSAIGGYTMHICTVVLDRPKSHAWHQGPRCEGRVYVAV